MANGGELSVTDVLRNTELNLLQTFCGRRHIVGQSSFHQPVVGQRPLLRMPVRLAVVHQLRAANIALSKGANPSRLPGQFMSHRMTIRSVWSERLYSCWSFPRAPMNALVRHKPLGGAGPRSKPADVESPCAETV